MNFFESHVSWEAINNVFKVLTSGYLSEGSWVARFERELGMHFGMSNPVAVNSGTSALHLALVLADVGPGDEVILPPQTFIATGLAILMCGATPVFADINPLTGNIDPESVLRKTTPRTKAIMPVHWGGYPCDMHEITRIAAIYNLDVIEDAAHALGAMYKGKYIGSISRFTAFSFQAIKLLTTGDGGALCCPVEGDYTRAKALRWFGIDRARDKVGELGEREYDLREVGFKYHMNNVAAAIGCGNIYDVTTLLMPTRRQLAYGYREALATIPGIELLTLSPDREHAWWLFTILVDRRDDFVRRMRECDIPVSVVHQRIDKNAIFGGPYDLPGQAEFDAHQVSLPLHHKMTYSDLAAMMDAIKGGW